MKNISFLLTIPQIKARTKTVTRRMGWADVRPGERLMACKKCQGLARGEQMVKLGVIGVVSVRKEPLQRMLDDPEYGRTEAALEGFPDMTAARFVEMFCDHMEVAITVAPTRIEFRYIDGDWQE